ncbi:response regulator transcription factor [Chondromyces apiculatus]|uniref:Response regulator receiver protein n=1 Tax=Chondromyces apiculatus DSM 436 TaxID=1192034 RepID=A0A017SVL3_9BACT|nr:response regulator [Chondromyces apiculatus]EYF00999.1 response regulator receiver protein [Chondromyces apiculatus DSM 436]
MARILIVDDDPSFGQIMKRKLERAGFEVTMRDGPFGTIGELKRGGYDALLLDVLMPALDGGTLVQLIRGTESIRAVRVLLCSSMDALELKGLAEKLHVEGYIPKSTPLDEMVATVRAVLNQPAAS